uniref:Uncharacterized protein n=1 Tax=Schizaphis graminum TaxID=13262 RepID=A0A2S2PA25_SCHGA
MKDTSSKTSESISYHGRLKQHLSNLSINVNHKICFMVKESRNKYIAYLRTTRDRIDENPRVSNSIRLLSALHRMWISLIKKHHKKNQHNIISKKLVILRDISCLRARTRI